MPLAPEQGIVALTAVAARARAAGRAMTHTAASRAAQEVAGMVKSEAARRGHALDIRVVARGDGVRLTIRGRHAGAYKAMVSQQMHARIPGVMADIRAQITRK